MRNTLIQEAGEAMYGSSWRADLANALRISHEKLDRMISGEEVIAIEYYGDILAYCIGKIQRMEEIAREIRQASRREHCPKAYAPSRRFIP